MSSSSSFFLFHSALLQPKISIKIIKFAEGLTSKNWVCLQSFRKSLAWSSSSFSRRFTIRIRTLRKIKNWLLLIEFLNRLIKSNLWFGFSQTDILDRKKWEFLFIRSVIENLSEPKPNQVKIFSTNKILNKIFKGLFLKTLVQPKYLTYFKLKYFSTAKYTMSLAISNSLKNYTIKFFTFFLMQKTLAKKLFFLNENKSYFFKNFNFKNFFNFGQFFKNKYFFIFPQTGLSFEKFIIFYFNFKKWIELLTSHLFFWGMLINDLPFNQLTSNQVLFWKFDDDFIWFFLNIKLNSNYFTTKTNFTNLTTSLFLNDCLFFWILSCILQTLITILNWNLSILQYVAISCANLSTVIKWNLTTKA
jgi:hypothetical protein